MNWAIVKKTWRQLLDSKLRLVVITMILLALYIQARMQLVSTSSVAFLANLITWTVGIGMISSDYKFGINMLVFTRPLPRWKYVISKWLSVSFFSTALMVIFFSMLAVGWTLGAAELGKIFLIGVSVCFCTAALITFFSSIPYGFSDLGFYLIVWLGILLLGMMGRQYELAPLSEASKFLSRLFYPTISGSSTELTLDLAKNAMSGGFGLAMAILLNQMRQLGYSSPD